MTKSILTRFLALHLRFLRSNEAYRQQPNESGAQVRLAGELTPCPLLLSMWQAEVSGAEKPKNP
jgi:hypothetical protein